MSLLKYFSPVKKTLVSNAAALAASSPAKRLREEPARGLSMTECGDKRVRPDTTLSEPLFDPANIATRSSLPTADVPSLSPSNTSTTFTATAPTPPTTAAATSTLLTTSSSSSLPVETTTPSTTTETVGSSTPTVPASPMTEAQQARMEANRLAALEKRRQLEEKSKAVVDFNAITYADMEKLFVAESWKKLVEKEFKKPYFANLKNFLALEQANNRQIFPPLQKVFRAFDQCPVENVKVVIIGQDPYHDDRQAEGLCFSVPKGEKIPSSLQNIFKELADCVPGFKRPNHGHLGAWCAQGVFLLNTGLTVRAHEANSHNGKGWQQFTDAVITQLTSHREGLIFFLWGKHAQDKEKLINKSKKHTIFKCAHPSGLSASRGFFGCRHFALANELLQKRGVAPIDWQI